MICRLGMSGSQSISPLGYENTICKCFGTLRIVNVIMNFSEHCCSHYFSHLLFGSVAALPSSLAWQCHILPAAALHSSCLLVKFQLHGIKFTVLCFDCSSRLVLSCFVCRVASPLQATENYTPFAVSVRGKVISNSHCL